MNLRLKMKILEAGKTQVALAGLLGITEGYMSKIVNGHLQPSPELAHEIARELNTSVDDLFV